MDKKLLLATVLSILTVLGMHYFIPRSDRTAQNTLGSVQPGQAYTVPAKASLNQPVNREIDFIDKKQTVKQVMTKLHTDVYTATFTNYGATLASLDFKKHKGANALSLRTIWPSTFYEREQGAFLIALDTATPYFYELEEKSDQGSVQSLTYKAETDGWIIRKTYTMQADSYALNLHISLVPKTGAQRLVPRLFYPAPVIPEISGDKVEAFSSGIGAQSITSISSADQKNKAWVMPALFGAANKYFAHMLVNDDKHFVQRAFYKKVDAKLFSILEGPVIEDSYQCSLSFYCGPKLLGELQRVDSRLEGLLSFGILSPICKFLLYLLKWLFNLLGNFGVAIILLTILVKIPFLPFSMKSRTMTEQMSRHQPALNRIRQKYKNDRKRMEEETIRYYTEHNISPVTTLLGCLPSLLQMPILFALYRVLHSYLALYQAPLGGWITDLSAADPYYVLPIIMGGAMILSLNLTSSGFGDTRSKVILIFGALLFTAVFLNLPAGLALYWAMSSIFSIGEEFLRRALQRKR